MDGGIQKFTKEVADFFVQEKELKTALSQEEYNKTIDSSFLKQVK